MEAPIEPVAFKAPEPLDYEQIHNYVARVVTAFEEYVQERDRHVDLLTENMIKLQKALLATNQKIADMERRNSPLIDINGRAMRKN